MFFEQEEEFVRQTRQPDSPQVNLIEMNVEGNPELAEDESVKDAIEVVQTDIHDLKVEMSHIRRKKAHDRDNGVFGGEMNLDDFSKVNKALSTASEYLEHIRKQHTSEREGINRDDHNSLEEVEEIVYSMAADQNIWGAKRLDSTGDQRLNYVSDISQDIVSFLSVMYDKDVDDIKVENIDRVDYEGETFTILDHREDFREYKLKNLTKDYF